MRSCSLNKENWAEDIICSLRIPQGITSEGSWRCHWAVLTLEHGISQSSRLGMRWHHRIPCLIAQDGKQWEATSSVKQGRWLFLTVGRGSWHPRKSVLSTHGPCVSFSLLVWAGPFDLVLSFLIPWNTGPRSSSHPYCATVTHTSILVLCYTCVYDGGWRNHLFCQVLAMKTWVWTPEPMQKNQEWWRLLLILALEKWRQADH